MEDDQAAGRFLNLLQQLSQEYDLLRSEIRRLHARDVPVEVKGLQNHAVTEKAASAWHLKLATHCPLALQDSIELKASDASAELVNGPSASVFTFLAAAAAAGSSRSPRLVAASVPRMPVTPPSPVPPEPPSAMELPQQTDFSGEETDISKEVTGGTSISSLARSKNEALSRKASSLAASPKEGPNLPAYRSSLGSQATWPDSVGKVGTAKLQEQPEERTEFVLKVVWLEPPESTGVWGQEVDEEMVRMQALAMKQKGASRMSTTRKTVRQTTLSRSSLAVNNPDRLWILHPRDPVRLYWDVVGLLAIFYDLITVPLQALEPKDNAFTIVAQWLTLVYWSCDIFVSLRTGFYEKGHLIMKPWPIARHYAQTWAIPDFIIVVPDWVLTILGSGSAPGRLTRFLRSSRAVRMIRLLRLGKLSRLITVIYDSIDSEYAFVSVQLAQLLFSIMILNHYTACGWYLVGNICRRTTNKANWIEDAGKVPAIEGDIWYRYTTSLHWSMTQFTPASMDVSATNLPERVYSIFILFWALVALSSVIGSITASMTAMRNMRNDEMRNFWMVRRYLRQQRISPNTKERVMKYIDHKVEMSRTRVSPHKVAFLDLLSEQLRLELTNEMSAPLLMEHPFFKYVNEEMRMIMYRLCSQALVVTPYANGDEAFEVGEWATSMYFVKAGVFLYEMGSGSKLSLIPGNWVSEAVLWTSWRHLGNFRAAKPAELTGVRPEKFAEVLRTHPKPWRFARTYGESFVGFISEVIEPGALSDVLFSEEFFSALEAVIRHAKDAEATAARMSGGRLRPGDIPDDTMCPQPSSRNGNKAHLRSIKDRFSLDRDDPVASTET